MLKPEAGTMAMMQAPTRSNFFVMKADFTMRLVYQSIIENHR